MATPAEKLAASLEVLQGLQDEGHIAIRSGDLTRTHLERLLRNGFLQKVMKGWYIPARPDESAGEGAGESTAWHASYWNFCAAYLNAQKGDDWCLSPEQSISIHAENWTVPGQLLVRAKRGQNNVISLPFATSLLEIKAELPEKDEITMRGGLNLYTLPAALVACSPGFFLRSPAAARTALSMIRDSSEVLEKLLEGGRSTVAGRLAGAFRNIGRDSLGNEIVSTMKAAGYDIRESDPFPAPSPWIFSEGEHSPYVNRLRLLWLEMREEVIKEYPEAPGLPRSAKKYLKDVEDIYKTDAYHSLSIEGYRVTSELIERVRQGDWDPDSSEDDRRRADALAARGYWQAFQQVKASIGKILGGARPGEAVSADHREWYREMFAPSVMAGLIKAADLAGYRNGKVYIRRSRHVPPDREIVRDAMPALFELLCEEDNPAVRVVLGHFMFVYIHPYLDGNGRMGRFLMNCMRAGGGYPWLVIPVERRNAYMETLEEASVNGNIIPFTRFLAGLTPTERR